MTALSGSGPAYVFALVEAMAEAGAALGLPPIGDALRPRDGRGRRRIDASRARDAGRAVARKRHVAGGTTAAALAVLRAPDGLVPLMRRAVAAAHRRAGELAG